MLKSKTKLVIYGNKYCRAIKIPAEIKDDSQFPFSLGEELSLEIQGDRMIIEKIKPEEEKENAETENAETEEWC